MDLNVLQVSVEKISWAMVSSPGKARGPPWRMLRLYRRWEASPRGEKLTVRNMGIIRVLGSSNEATCY
jgi:hypothetical protein